MINHNLINEVLKEVAQKEQEIILDQLGELISRGLLVVEREQPVLVQSSDSARPEIRMAIRLKLKDQEYIEKLENQLKAVQAILQQTVTLDQKLKELQDEFKSIANR